MNSFSLADGQLPITNPAKLTGGDQFPNPAANYPGQGVGGFVSGTFRNTSSSNTETVILYVSRNGGTNREIFRATLAPHEGFEMDNLALDPKDNLLGVTTHATTVDYFLFRGNGAGEFNIEVFDSGGAEKINLNSYTSASSRLAGALLAGSPTASETYASAVTIDVTKTTHIIAASHTTSATSTYTPSAAGNAGDILIIQTEADGTGTVTVTFASTFHSSGTQASTSSTKSTIMFQSDGTQWNEIARTTALA